MHNGMPMWVDIVLVIYGIVFLVVTIVIAFVTNWKEYGRIEPLRYRTERLKPPTPAAKDSDSVKHMADAQIHDQERK